VVGIVLVSHSAELARGLADVVAQVAGGEVAVEPAGGAPGGGLGTSADLVAAGIGRADHGDGVVVIGDLGSSILTVRHLLEHLGTNGRVRLADAPLVEGAIAASVVAAGGATIDEVVTAAESARDARKF
jgi:phosphoenolpyruvate---glycerone phosphotransferase subunit DhaM